MTVNYTESHDDFCWLDRITENAANNGSEPTEVDAKRTRLMGAALMASLGIPMLSEGQDFLRSKYGVSNTYLRGDLNALDYTRLKCFKDTHEYFRAWIAFRLSADGTALRIGEPPADGFFRFFENDRQGVLGILYNADGRLSCPPLFAAFNPHMETTELHVCGIDAAGFRQLANGSHFHPQGLPQDDCYRWVAGTLQIPPLSAGLWQTVNTNQE